MILRPRPMATHPCLEEEKSLRSRPLSKTHGLIRVSVVSVCDPHLSRYIEGTRLTNNDVALLI